MTVLPVLAHFYFMPESGYEGHSFRLPMRLPQWNELIANASLVMPHTGGVLRVACFAVSVARDGITLKVCVRNDAKRDVRFEDVRFGHTDWSIAWADLGFSGDQTVEGRCAISTFEMIENRIAARIKRNHGKRKRGSKDLERREHYEATVLCLESTMSRRSAIRKAIEGCSPDELPSRVACGLARVSAEKWAHDRRDRMSDLLRDEASSIRKVIAAAKA